MLSHQLRTPLAVLQAQVQNAQRGDSARRGLCRAVAVGGPGDPRCQPDAALAKVAQLESEAPEALRANRLVSLGA